MMGLEKDIIEGPTMIQGHYFHVFTDGKIGIIKKEELQKHEKIGNRFLIWDFTINKSMVYDPKKIQKRYSITEIRKILEY